jgi:hypothetical protein
MARPTRRPSSRRCWVCRSRCAPGCTFALSAISRRAIQHTTYLLLITHDRINVAAKLYDYLGGGKPILAAVHRDGDVRRLLEETRTGWWADVDDVAAIRQLLVEAVERGPEVGAAFQPQAERIAGYHRRPLTRRYAGLLTKLAPNARAKHSQQ